MRAIDADALIEEMEAYAEHTDDIIAKMFTYAFISDVKHAHTIELEREKGHWIKAIDEQGETWMCSECLTEYAVDEMDEFPKWAKFCPNCGADMRGERDEQAD